MSNTGDAGGAHSQVINTPGLFVTTGKAERDD